MIPRRHEHGDTIVEVLISMAIVSLILGGAYATTNRSLQSTRADQEQTTALKIAQGQLEEIKSAAITNPNFFTGATLVPFCVDATGTIFLAGNNACKSGSGQLIYQTSVQRTNTNDITLTESWQDVRGRNTDTVQLHYRVYQ
ncbi:MAG TPA: prepilin-type N-terminal cleavage/methylation domain-containing protein [Candidatus Saccharimonadales bacterium]|nr:prepilin-type N-terminal cleavage/methylation domain-containing protein [Candidatus Saccharimonadales bacterium]